MAKRKYKRLHYEDRQTMLYDDGLTYEQKIYLIYFRYI